MAIDLSFFHLNNISDTCSVWNLLSSRLLYSVACSAGCNFNLTYFVYYECLHKPRKNPTNRELELQERLRKESEKGQFAPYHLQIEDLQDVMILERRMKLSKGELSCIAFAKKTNQAFLTDDQKARKLAGEVMDRNKIQTTPHLFGWLYFTKHLGNGDKDSIIKEHSSFSRPLEPYFESMYQEALRCRIMASSPNRAN